MRPTALSAPKSPSFSKRNSDQINDQNNNNNNNNNFGYNYNNLLTTTHNHHFNSSNNNFLTVGDQKKKKCVRLLVLGQDGVGKSGKELCVQDDPHKIKGNISSPKHPIL